MSATGSFETGTRSSTQATNHHMAGYVAFSMLLCLVACAFHIPAPTSGAPEAVPLVAPSTDPDRIYALIDDRLWFVDTGASRTTCDDDLVAALGLSSSPTPYASAGEAGTVALERAVLPDVTVGGWRWRRLPCAVRDLGTTSSIPEIADDPVAGVLGADLFRRFVLELDLASGRMWMRPRSAGSGEGARLSRERGVGQRLIAPLVVDGVDAPAIVDTGADQTYLGLQSGPVLQRYQGTRRGSGPSGSVPVEVVIRGVGEASIDGLPIALPSYIHRVGDVGLLGMNALDRETLVVDSPHRRLRWSGERVDRLPRPDEARRALLETDGSDAGLSRLAAFDLAHRAPLRAAEIYRRLGDSAREAYALLAAGRWTEAERLLATADPAGTSAAARVVRVVQTRGDPAEILPDAPLVRRAWAETRTVRDQVWALEQGAPANTIGRGTYGPVLHALALEKAAPGASAAPCAQLPDPQDAEVLLLVVLCGQRDRAFSALERLRAAAPEDPGLLDVAVRLGATDAAALLDRAVRLAPFEAYFHLRRRGLRP